MDMTTKKCMQTLLNIQKNDFIKSGVPTSSVRIGRLKKCLNLLLDNKEELVRAVSEDFGHRSSDLTLFADVASSVSAVKHAIKHAKKWMVPEKRGLRFPLGLLGARSEVVYQPKGVVGIVAPWNFPIGLVFIPLANALVAGNRAMIKPSEHTPKTSNLIAKLIGDVFDETEVCVVQGGPEVGARFVSLPFDHIIFTGPANVGRLVLAAAAKNLTPVTLELGGKSPVILGRSANLYETAERVAFGKFMNAGQVCLSPDYLFIDNERRDEFVSIFKQAIKRLFPSIKGNNDYSTIISERHYSRLKECVQDARDKGAEVIEVNPAKESFSDSDELRKMQGYIIINPHKEMKVMQEEIFGPILPVMTYDNVLEAVDYINSRPNPLAIYYFGNDKAEEQQILVNTLSGGVTVNGVILHGASDNAPFGGVGESGMGNYHGIDGFKTFSHARTIQRHPGSFSIERLLGFIPPYGRKMKAAIKHELGD